MLVMSEETTQRFKTLEEALREAIPDIDFYTAFDVTGTPFMSVWIRTSKYATCRVTIVIDYSRAAWEIRTEDEEVIRSRSLQQSLEPIVQIVAALLIRQKYRVDIAEQIARGKKLVEKVSPTVRSLVALACVVLFVVCAIKYLLS